MIPAHKKYILDNIRRKSIKQISKDLGIPERKVRKFLEQSSKKGPEAPTNPPKFVGKKSVVLSIALIIAGGFMAYANSLNGKFLFDDKNYIVDNNFIKNPSEVINYCFTKDIGASVGMPSDFYRPLQMLTYALNYRIGKLDVIGYHLTNTIFHILMALCIYWFISILFNNNMLALLTALLFVLHPIHTEAVSYISGRADSMAGFFILLSMIIYIKLLGTQRFYAAGLLLLCLAFLCALLSKEYSLMLPVLIVFYHFVFGKKVRLSGLLCLLFLGGVYTILRLTCLNFWAGPTNPDTVFDRLPGVFVALLNYYRLLILPLGLHMEYGYKLFLWSDTRVIMGFALTLAILIGGYLKRNDKIILFSLGWFFLTLIPVSNLYKINFFMTEHFLYMPSIGFFILAAYLLNTLFNNNRYKVFALVLMICIPLVYLVLTVRQNSYWQDPLTFYERTLKYAPDSAGVYNNLGNMYAEKGDLDKALSYYTKSIELNPHSYETYSNRGNIYNRTGHDEKAVLDYNKSIELNPGNAQAYNNLGNTYTKLGRYVEAMSDLNKAIELKPDLAEAFYNRGNLYSKLGRQDKALLDFNKAIELNPQYFQAYNDRGNVYNQMGRYSDALFNFNKAIEIRPDFAEAYDNRGVMYGNQGNYREAILNFDKAITLAPRGALFYVNRAIVDYSMGELAKSMADCNKAIALNPDYPQAYFNRGNVYLSRGHDDLAIADFNKAIKLKADYADAYNNRGRAYVKKGEYGQALSDFNKSIEFNPNLALAYINRAVVFYLQKEFDKSRNDVRKAQGLGAKVDQKLVEALKQAPAAP